ncbi:MAG: AAA family ATPase [Polyangiales bacterium]
MWYRGARRGFGEWQRAERQRSLFRDAAGASSALARQAFACRRIPRHRPLGGPDPLRRSSTPRPDWLRRSHRRALTPRPCARHRRPRVSDGAPGLGKSRLLDVFRLEAATRGIRGLRGTCESYGEIAPFEPFVQVLRQIFGVVAAMPLGAAVDAVTQYVSALDAPLQDELPTLLQLLSLQPWPDSADASSLRAMRAVHALITTLARLEPTCLVLDDWQWADDSSRELLHRIRRDTRAGGLCITVAIRSGARLDPVFEHADVVALSPLSDAEAATMIHAVLPPGLDIGVQRTIHQRAGGNPLFIEELCRVLPGHAATPGANVPSTLHEVIQARFALIPEPTAGVLRVASVIGHELSSDLLAKLVGAEALAPLSEGVAGDLLVAGDHPNSLRFKHGITREVIYESVRIADRRGIHRKVAELIEAAVAEEQSADQSEALAHHYLGCGDTERAVFYAERAGHKAAASSALDRARAHYQTVLSQLDQRPQTAEIRRHWLDTCMKLAVFCVYNPAWSQLAMLERAIEQACDLGDARVRATAEHWLGWLYHVLGLQGEALVHYGRAKELTGQNQPKLEAQVWAALGQTYVAAARYPEARECLARGLTLKRTANAGRRSASLAQGFAYALGCKALMHADLGDFATAERDFDEATESVRGSGHAIELSVLGLRHMMLIWRGDFARCLATIERCRHDAERVHAPYVFAMNQAFEGYAAFMQQRTHSAIRALRDAVDWLEAREIALFLSFNYGGLADALEQSGDQAAARQAAACTLQCVSRGDVLGEALAYRVLARSHAAEPTIHWRQVDIYLDKANQSAARRGSRREQAVTQLERAELYMQSGRAPEALALIPETKAELEKMGMHWHAARASALVSGS